jgi:dihydrodiol dehydrogenase / D-xylose 1-dehydrogenase (NADP)
MESKATCRWAALALSNIASVFFQDLLGREDAQYEHKLVAVSTTGSAERAQKWFKDHKIPEPQSITIYDSWHKMLEEGDFDIVYVSTPHPLHFEEVLKALQCKRNILVEKPATMNAAQYRRCIELAIQQGVVLMEAMWTRYLPATRYFQTELLPRIGKVRRVYSDFSFPIVGIELADTSRFLDKTAGAGALLDLGVYALTWADIALNEIEMGGTNVVHSSSWSVPERPGEVDDINTVVLANKSATAIVTTSMTIPGSSKPPFYIRFRAQKAAPSVRIEATEASVAIPFPPIRPEELHVQWYGDAHLNEDGTEKNEIIKKPVSGWGIWYQADVIAAAVFQKRPGAIGAQESLRVLEWLDEARSLAGITYDEKLEQL